MVWLRAGEQFALGQPSNSSGIATVQNATTLPPSKKATATVTIFCECDGVPASCASSCNSGLATFVTIKAAYSVPLLISYPTIPNPFPLTKPFRSGCNDGGKAIPYAASDPEKPVRCNSRFHCVDCRIGVCYQKTDTGVSAVNSPSGLSSSFSSYLASSMQDKPTTCFRRRHTPSSGRYAMINPQRPTPVIIQQAQTNLYSMNVNAVTFTTATSTSGNVNYRNYHSAVPVFSFLPARMFPYGTITLSEHVTVPLMP